MSVSPRVRVRPMQADFGLIVRLGDTSPEVGAVGGKASALSRMMASGLPVPRGFILTTDALESHLGECGRGVAIEEVCRGLDPHRPEDTTRVAERAASFIRSGPVPATVRKALFAAAAPLIADGPVVVRSSAVDEDGLEESFAGQLDSILHVRDTQELEEAILTCWASLWSARALFYRAARGMLPRGMAVVVQIELSPYAAGVLFTSAGSGVALVEYVRGPGDALMSGRTNPGRFSINRSSHAVDRLAYCEPPDEEFDDVLLEERQVEALACFADRLEGLFGVPQDVEWVMDTVGVIHVVQSRPITVPIKAPLLSASHTKQARTVRWSDANVNENFPAPVSPFLYSIASTGYSHYFHNLARAFGISRSRVQAMEPAFRQIIEVHGARIYYNLSNIHALLHMAPWGNALARSFDRFVGTDSSGLPAPGGSDWESTGRLRRLSETSIIAAKTTWQYLRLGRLVTRFERTVDDFAGRAHPNRLSQLSTAEVGAALNEMMEIRCHRWTDAALADVAAMVCYGALEALLLKSLGEEVVGGRHNSLLKAIPDVVSAEPVLRL